MFSPATITIIVSSEMVPLPTNDIIPEMDHHRETFEVPLLGTIRLRIGTLLGHRDEAHLHQPNAGIGIVHGVDKRECVESKIVSGDFLYVRVEAIVPSQINS